MSSNISANLEVIENAIYGKDMRAAIHDALYTLAHEDGPAGYIKAAFIGVNPDWEVESFTDRINAESPLVESPPYFLIPASKFNCAKDGLLVWRNVTELIHPRWYTFDTTSVAGQVKIIFTTSSRVWFKPGDRYEFTVYRKSNSGSSDGSGGAGALIVSLIGTDDSDIGGIWEAAS